jgi:Leucine-rich repeat (LRR) protein
VPDQKNIFYFDLAFYDRDDMIQRYDTMIIKEGTMDKQMKDMLLFEDDVIYAEARRRIEECREKKSKELDLSALNLKEIPSYLWTLDNLETLRIFNDSIESIPSAISGLKKLRKLRIQGEKIAMLPEEIGEQLSLTTLDLVCPRLESLPGSFANLKTMECFLFNECNLTAIPNYICSWTNLQKFELHMGGIFQGSSTKLKSIPRNIGNLKKLKQLALYCTSIVKIPDSLGNCPLECLVLSGGFSIVPETIGNLSKLKILKLFSDKPIILPDSIGKLLSLEELDIRAPALEIPATLGKLASLEDLHLLTEKELALPKSFGGLSALKDLWLDSPEMRGIPDTIGNCRNLKNIYISSDKMTTLPESFCELKKLQGLHLNTFALKALPAAFGNLVSLKSLDIFSGALIAFPESIGSLKKLVRLNLDTYNFKKLPGSFKKLSYIKYSKIQIGQNEQALQWKKDTAKKSSPASFEEFLVMSGQYRKKIFKPYSIKQLEALLCSLPQDSASIKKGKELFKDIMLERKCKLKRKLALTDENKKRIAKVSNEFIKAWEDGFAKAKLIIEALYKKEKDKNTFRDKYCIEITLHPEIAFSNNEDNSKRKLYYVITSYLNTEMELNMRIKYDPITRNEDNFGENIHINWDFAWNFEGLRDIAIEGYKICYALNVLYSHNNWAFEDILRINNIVTEIRVNCDGESF